MDLVQTANNFRAARQAVKASRKATDEARTEFGNLDRNTTVKALKALNVTGKHIYAGTVPAPVIAKRRARNKQARRSRRVNVLTNARKGSR